MLDRKERQKMAATGPKGKPTMSLGAAPDTTGELVTSPTLACVDAADWSTVDLSAIITAARGRGTQRPQAAHAYGGAHAVCPSSDDFKAVRPQPSSGRASLHLV